MGGFREGVGDLVMVIFQLLPMSDTPCFHALQKRAPAVRRQLKLLGGKQGQGSIKLQKVFEFICKMKLSTHLIGRFKSMNYG